LQDRPECLQRDRPGGERRACGRRQLAPVRPGGRVRRRAGAGDLVEHRLHERAQQQSVARCDQVDRAAHQQHPDRRTPLQRRGDLGRFEAVEARVQGEVRRQRVLCLQTEQVLGHRQGRQGRPGEEVLAAQERPVQDASGQHPATGRS
jgi:hypothetical protein